MEGGRDFQATPGQSGELAVSLFCQGRCQRSPVLLGHIHALPGHLYSLHLGDLKITRARRPSRRRIRFCFAAEAQSKRDFPKLLNGIMEFRITLPCWLLCTPLGKIPQAEVLGPVCNGTAKGTDLSRGLTQRLNSTV